MTNIRLLTALALAGCGGAPGGTPAASDGGAPQAPTATAIPTITATPPAPAPEAGTRTVSLRYEDTSAPGYEGMKCLDVPGPKSDTWVRGWRVRNGAVHHSDLWQRTGAPTYPAPVICDKSLFDGNVLIFDSSVPLLDYEMPEGSALLLKGGQGLIFDVHELNNSLDPATSSVDVELLVSDPPAHEVRSIELLTGLQMAIPPHTQQTLAATCVPPKQDVSLIQLIGHGHSHSKSVTAALDGAEIYRSTTWADPPVGVFDMLPIGPGHSVSFACEIDNTTDQTLKYCNKVDSCEMCILFGLAVTASQWTCQR
jgi:hypothetical protein